MSNEEMIVRLTEIIGAQEEIIDLQKKAIDSLTLLLREHIPAAELDSLSATTYINKAAEIRREMEGL